MDTKYITQTSCHFLFGGEADIFENIKMKPIETKRAFIDESLKVLMKVNLAFFKQGNTLPFYSCRAFNEGCHLYSRQIIQLKNKPEETLTEEEQRFLHLTFFLSFILLADMKLFIKTIKNAMEVLQLQAPLPHKQFDLFLLDEGKRRETASRIALNKIYFEPYMKRVFVQSAEENVLYSELNLLASSENLMKESHNFRSVKLYTYPTFPALVFIVDRIFKENIPFVIKVKILTKEGVAGTIVKVFGEARNQDPVLVLEGIGTDAYTIPFCREKAQGCPRYYRRYPEVRKRHPESKTCFLCHPAPEEVKGALLAPFYERFKIATESISTLFYAFGVDATEKHQRPFFENQDKYPMLTQIFRETEPKVDKLGLGMERPIAFSLCHAHVNTFEKASQEMLFMDTPPEEFLQRM